MLALAGRPASQASQASRRNSRREMEPPGMRQIVSGPWSRMCGICNVKIKKDGVQNAWEPTHHSGKSGVRQQKLDLIRIWSDVGSPMCVCTASRTRSRFVGTLRTGRCDQFYSGTGKGLRCRWLAPSENRRAGREGNVALGEGDGCFFLFTTEYEMEGLQSTKR